MSYKLLFCVLFVVLPSSTSSVLHRQCLPVANASSSVVAQKTGLPNVDQILDRFIETKGGKDAIKKLTSRSGKGTFEIPTMEIKGSIEVYEKAPNKLVTIITIPNYGVIQNGFTGAVGYSKYPNESLRQLSGAELAEMKREADFYKELKFKELYAKIELNGKEKINNRDAYIVEATPAEGNPSKMYFDAQTGVQVRVDSYNETPQGKVPVETYYEDYRELNGMKIPFTTRINNSALGWIIIKFSEISHNVQIDDVKFNEPSAR